MACGFIKTSPAHLAVFLKFLPQCWPTSPGHTQSVSNKCPSKHIGSQRYYTQQVSEWDHSIRRSMNYEETTPGTAYAESPWRILGKGNRASWLAGRAQRVLWSSSHMSPILSPESGWEPEAERDRETERERGRVGEQNFCLSCIYVESVVHRWKM